MLVHFWPWSVTLDLWKICRGIESSRESEEPSMAKTLNSRESTDDYVVLKAVQEAWEVAKNLKISGIHGNIHLRSSEVLIRMGKLP